MTGLIREFRAACWMQIAQWLTSAGWWAYDRAEQIRPTSEAERQAIRAAILRAGGRKETP